MMDRLFVCFLIFCGEGLWFGSFCCRGCISCVAPGRRQRRCLGDSSHRLYSRPGYDGGWGETCMQFPRFALLGMRDEFRRMMVVLYFESLPNFRRYFFARLVLLKLWYLYVPGCMSTVCFADTYLLCNVCYCVKRTQYPMVFHSMSGEGLCGSQPLQPLGPIAKALAFLPAFFLLVSIDPPRSTHSKSFIP